MSDLRIRIEGCRPAFLPRAHWVLTELASALERTPRFVTGEADCVYGPHRPSDGIWLPADDGAQAFFERRDRWPTRTAFVTHGLPLVFAPTTPDEAIPGDIVAGAFYLMSRWDSWCAGDPGGPGTVCADSCFGRIVGLDPADPPVERYIVRMRELLGAPEPTAWTVHPTHAIDPMVRGDAAGIARRARSAITGARRPRWDNVPAMLWTTSQRGIAPTVYLDASDDAARAARGDLARAVRVSGGEVALRPSAAAADDPDGLAAEVASLRSRTGLAVLGVGHDHGGFRYHETVRRLERAGVEHCTSLGFVDALGYPAGVARAVRPYLIGDERPATVRVLTRAVADVTLANALRLDADAARERSLAVLDAARRGGAVALMWHNTNIGDVGVPGYGDLWELLLDELVQRGASCGPLRPPPPRPGARIDGRRIRHVTSVHRPRDVRIFHKETAAARAAGADAEVMGLDAPVPRSKRLQAGWRLVRRAARERADVYHFHDPELLPAAIWLRRRTGAKVVYDLHEYLGGAVRDKRWLAPGVRRPLARVVERVEQAMGSRLSGIVGSNEDLAVRFAIGGQPAAVVTNAPWSSAFPVPPPPTEPIVLYVGGLSPVRGLDVMTAAFAQVTHPGARLLLVGPGDPGELADNVEWLGVVDHSEVAALVARAAVAWVPLQYNGNYLRIVPTKLIEAMASARPVVTSNFGRMAQITRAADCGLLVPPDDATAHARAIDRLLGDPDLAARLGASGRRAFERGWSFELQADRLTAFYSDLIDGTA